jgi:hypothetical protein
MDGARQPPGPTLGPKGAENTQNGPTLGPKPPNGGLGGLSFQGAIQPDGKASEKAQDKDKKRERAQRFQKPTVQEVAAYCNERSNEVDAETFVDFYTANGWVQGTRGKPIKDWKAAVRTWEKSDIRRGGKLREDDVAPWVKKRLGQA